MKLKVECWAQALAQWGEGIHVSAGAQILSTCIISNPRLGDIETEAL